MAVPPKKVTFFIHEDLTFLMNIYSFLDRERQVLIVAEDVADALSLFKGLETTPEDFTELLAQFDLKGSDTINWPKFLEIMKTALSLSIFTESAVTKTLRELDPENRGYITADQMKDLLLMNQGSGNMTEQDAQDLLELAPKDEIGNINYKEFNKLFVILGWLPKTNTGWRANG